MDNLEGPDGFLRYTFVLQEAKDSWPIVYVWEGDSRHDKGALVRWVFKNGTPYQTPVWWDTYKDPLERGLMYGKRSEDRRPLTYEEWWAFIYYAATKGAEDHAVADLEKLFFEEVLQPQTAEEKSDV